MYVPPQASSLSKERDASATVCRTLASWAEIYVVTWMDMYIIFSICVILLWVWALRRADPSFKESPRTSTNKVHKSGKLQVLGLFGLLRHRGGEMVKV